MQYTLFSIPFVQHRGRKIVQWQLASMSICINCAIRFERPTYGLLVHVFAIIYILYSITAYLTLSPTNDLSLSPFIDDLKGIHMCNNTKETPYDNTPLQRVSTNNILKTNKNLKG